MVFPFDLFDWLFGAGKTAAGGIGNWLSSIGGSIASGLESGFIAVLKDIWDVIRPPIYIALGVIFIVWAWAYLFKVNPLQLAKLAFLVAK